MPISLQCPCGKTLKVDEQYRGKKVKCPKCGNVLLVEDAETETAVQAEAPTKRPAAADDERETRTPVKRPDTGTRSKMPMLALGGCAAVLLLGCLISVGAGGWWIYSKSQAEKVQADADKKKDAEAADEFGKRIKLAAQRTQSNNNLKQMALAIHMYHDMNRHLPAVGFSSRQRGDGKPLLSWRVAILPFIEQEPLYRKFDLNEAWDHPTNQKLISQMPQIYLMPGDSDETHKAGKTHYRTLDGPSTMLAPSQRVGPGAWLRAKYTLGNVPDGTSNTIMIVEASEPTIWTRPDDLVFDPNGPLPKFGVRPGGFLVALGDGSVRMVSSKVTERTLRNAITADDGQPLGADWD